MSNQYPGGEPQVANGKSNGNNVNTHSTANAAIKDDWAAKNETKSNDTFSCVNKGAPSFIRLFILHRILRKKFSNQDKHVHINSDAFIKLFDDINDNNKQEIAKKIAIRLVELGIKNYMQTYYNEKEQCRIIETMMNKIIFNKFLNEYKHVINYHYTCVDKNDTKKYIKKWYLTSMI